MRLHYHPLSPYSRKAQVAVWLRGDPVELREVDVFAGELRSKAFRALSPFGKMPVLETDDGPLVESTSIIEWLEERGPRALLPAGQERIARHFDRLGDLYLVAPMAELWWHPDSDGAAKAPETARAAWGLFARRIDGQAFVCGAAFSLGDLAAAIATDYLERVGVEPPSAIRAWKDRCFEVPAMARSLEAALPWVERTLGARARQP